MRPTLHLAVLALLAFPLVPRPAAAETYQTCAGFIDSVPATISTQGTWCLRHDLSTAMASGAAITIATNNVTVDCNDFKLGGLAAGDGTLAVGIKAASRLNATVRHCNVRGFLYGAMLSGGGHAVLDSRFDSNTFVGISVAGDGTVVQRNRVSDTGGSSAPGYGDAFGIYFGASGAGLVLDNFVQGVYTDPDDIGSTYGLMVQFRRGEVARNTITSLETGGTGNTRGIVSTVVAGHAVIHDNTIGTGLADPVPGIGVSCGDAIARDNTVSGFTLGFSLCADAGGNFSN